MSLQDLEPPEKLKHFKSRAEDLLLNLAAIEARLQQDTNDSATFWFTRCKHLDNLMQDLGQQIPRLRPNRYAPIDAVDSPPTPATSSDEFRRYAWPTTASSSGSMFELTPWLRSEEIRLAKKKEELLARPRGINADSLTVGEKSLVE